MTAQKRHFIVIDDNKLDCFIAEKLIANTGKSEKVRSFIDAREAFELIKNDRPVNNGSKVIIIVDIQMPLMNGFEFVEAFETLNREIQDHYDIFILSSTINQTDLNRVRNYRSVKHLLNKPLTTKLLSSMIEP